MLSHWHTLGRAQKDSPFAELRLKGALVKRRVESNFRAHGEFVTRSVAAQPNDEAPLAGLLAVRENRSRGSQPAITGHRAMSFASTTTSVLSAEGPAAWNSVRVRGERNCVPARPCGPLPPRGHLRPVGAKQPQVAHTPDSAGREGSSSRAIA